MNKVIKYCLIYLSVSSYLNMETELTNAWSFGYHIITKAWYAYNVIQLYVSNDSESEDKYDKSKNRINFVMRKIHHVKLIATILVFLWYPINFCIFVLYPNSTHWQFDNNPIWSRQSTHLCTWMKHLITNTEIRILNPLNTKLLDLFHRKLTGYSTGTNTVIGKLVDLPQWFRFLRCGNRINKILVFWCSHITKSLICLQCDSIICLKWFLPEENMIKLEIETIFFMQTIHHVKAIAIRLVFLCSSIFFLLTLSSNLIH